MEAGVAQIAYNLTSFDAGAEKASACKNAGVAAAAAADDASCPPDRALRFACAAANDFTLAVEHGQACMEQEWVALCTSRATAACDQGVRLEHDLSLLARHGT